MPIFTSGMHKQLTFFPNLYSKNQPVHSTTFHLVLERIRYQSLKFFVNRYLYLHKVDKIYIDLPSLGVKMSVADAFESPVKFSFWRFDIERFLGQKNFRIDSETFGKINQILIEKYDEEYKQKEENRK